MFVTLSHINPFLLSLGVPQLEYLAFSYCNEFASFSPYFYSESMKEGFCKGDWSGILQEIPQINFTMEYVTTHL